MKITTLRLPEGLAEDLENEAEEEDMSFSEYARGILRNRDRIPEENTQENTDEYGKRIRALEQRVAELEDEIGPDDDRDRDIVDWLRDNQPASRAEIIDHCYPDDHPAKPVNWWKRHGRQLLKDAGAEFTRNVGWTLDER